MFSHPREDLVAGVVVFLVAVPLCLGIAVASGVPPVSGLVAGVVGGIVVPFLSRSALSVTGPAAGLTAIVLTEVTRLGGLERFLAAVIVGGAVQLLLGVLRAGKYAELVPSAVIKGMLAAIGITIVVKQVPVAVGASGLPDLVSGFSPGAAVISAASLAVLLGWRHTPLAKAAFLPPALVAVALGALLAQVFRGAPALALPPDRFVAVPVGGASALAGSVPRPDLGALLAPDVLLAGLTIALVASIETLLSLQAVDRLDPLRRHSPPDRELLAQGAANAVSGFLGGLPLTAVIVRSGANVAAGGRERLSAFAHGVLLLGAVLFAAPLLNAIPLACLAAVLVHVGLGLSRPALYAAQLRLGWPQFLPFAITIAAVLALDLLKGVILGIVVGVAFALHQYAKGVVAVARERQGEVLVRFRRDGTFLSKPRIIAALDGVRDGERVVIDASGEFIDQDVREVIADFVLEAPQRRIHVEVRGIELPRPAASAR